jgi:tripartite ATP-independent transporter DctM subunit
MATIVASGGFAAMSGSSLATAGTMARVAYPEMRRFNYSRSLATASIAAGGTLGILIPPSIMMVFYGILTETGIGELFAAGFLPGLLGVLGYMLAVRFVTWRDPEHAPPGERIEKAERRRALRRVGLVLLLIAIVLGGIYGGVFTPTEAAGVGAFGGLAIAVWRRSLTWPVLSAVLTDTVITTAKMFAIFLGALVFSDMIGFSGLPDQVVDWLTGSGIPPLAVILVMVLIYLVMGCFLESLSMILITIPVFFPVVVSLGYDPIWFGIIVVVAVEIGLITPPLGMNLFMLKSTVPDVETSHLFRGIAPFVGIDLVRIAILILLPGISLFLPRLFFG